MEIASSSVKSVITSQHGVFHTTFILKDQIIDVSIYR
jgi:hypothetical protein